MKFNMINWMVETFSILLVTIFHDDLVLIIYMLLIGCVTPLVYIFWIEDNRKSAKAAFRRMNLSKEPEPQNPSQSVVHENATV